MEQLCQQWTIASKTDILDAMSISNEWALAAGFTGSKPLLVQLATEEACTNAWEYQASVGEPSCEVQWYLNGKRLEITVFQQGGSFMLPYSDIPHQGTRGRGLVLIQGIMDEVRCIEGPTYTALWMCMGREDGHE